jgi:hypothetical protein
MLQDAYNTDVPAGTRRWLRRLMALPLLPVARVPAAFNAIVQAAAPVPQAADMHRYMTDTWIDAQSTFPPHLWNTYGLVSIDLNVYSFTRPSCATLTIVCVLHQSDSHRWTDLP